MKPRPLAAALALMVLAAPALAACGDEAASGPPATEVLSEPGDGAELKSDGFGVATTAPPGTTLTLQLTHVAFAANEARTNLVAYIPKAFDPARPVGLVVYLHGWWNCAENVVRPKNGSCVSRGASHNAYNLANQLEASGKNAILLVPELSFEQASSDPGRFVEDDFFYDLVDEALSSLGDRALGGGLSIYDVASIVVASHSGGYRAAAGIVAHGGLWVDELWLLDSLYGEGETFDAFVTDDVESFTAPATKRLASVYSKTGGTLAESQALAARLAPALPAGALLDDRTTATLTNEQLATPVLVKRTGLGHDDIPRYYFIRLLATSQLAPIVAPMDATPE